MGRPRSETGILSSSKVGPALRSRSWRTAPTGRTCSATGAIRASTIPLRAGPASSPPSCISWSDASPRRRGAAGPEAVQAGSRTAYSRRGSPSPASSSGPEACSPARATAVYSPSRRQAQAISCRHVGEAGQYRSWERGQCSRDNRATTRFCASCGRDGLGHGSRHDTEDAAEGQAGRKIVLAIEEYYLSREGLGSALSTSALSSGGSGRVSC